MTYQAKDFSNLLGMNGFEDQLLKNHFTLYNGYVTNTNKVAAQLNEMAKTGNVGTYEYGELKRRFGWEFNGMRLHELYFGNLGGDGKMNQNSKVEKSIVENFGSIENWQKDFKSSGTIRGIGWVILYKDSGKLFNQWVGEHHESHLATCTPLLVMDLWEHAFMLQFQLDKASYINAFFNNINWSIVESRM
ncbi:superoxide dismutase [bacterium]|nr:superoxide dismutase [bacterium]